MILETVFGWFRALANAVLDLLPDGSASTVDFSGWSVPAAVVDAIVPWSQVLYAAGVMLVWMLVCHTYRVVLWVLGVIHLSGDSV